MIRLYRAMSLRGGQNNTLKRRIPHILTPFDSKEAEWLLPCPCAGSICIFQVDPFVALDVYEQVFVIVFALTTRHHHVALHHSVPFGALDLNSMSICVKMINFPISK